MSEATPLSAVQSILQSILPVHVGSGLAPIQRSESLVLPREVGFAKRRQEFHSGRVCAVHALRQAGWTSNLSESAVGSRPGAPASEDLQAIVGVSSDRCPQWPTGFVGSISHSQNWSWAVAASAQYLAGIGIDTEVIMTPEIHETVRPEVGTELEWALVSKLALRPELETTLLFSIKETFFKLWYPLVKQFYDFTDVQLVQVAAESQLANADLRTHHLSFGLHTRRASTEMAGRADQHTMTRVDALWTDAEVFTVAWLDPKFAATS
ncbi:MAG: 4'-phosphopantetheinyl transferase superfamily protein [Pirellulaceae bacterium]|nr:4'-phosphopantetheinyl transferase superfamily protein [Pirellulaceae bacterium]